MSFRPVLMGEFRDCVRRKQWTAALTRARVLGLTRDTPQALFEYDEDYLRRLARIARQRKAKARERATAGTRTENVA